jgi:peptidoglycan lytic transglycosylase
MPARPLLALIASTFLATGAFARAVVPASPHAAGTSAKRAVQHPQHGRISWYGWGFAGRRTASGERYDPRALTMAHRSLPLGAIVLVINDDNGRRVALRVNDRGPFRRDRVADVSRAASLRLGFEDSGVTHATLKVLWVPSPPLDALAS